MKNYFIITGFLLINSLTRAQVGINTGFPQATLDIVSSSAPSIPDGIIAPRLTGNSLKSKDALYGTNQNGAIVFVTQAASPTTTKTIEVTKAGYFYYDAAAVKWIAFQPNTTNILGSSANTITSTINGVSASAPAVNSVSNTSTANSNTLTTTVNGVTGASVNLVKSVSNDVSATNFLTTTINGISSTPVAVKNIYNSDGTLTGNRVVTMAGNRLSFKGSTGNTDFSNNGGGASITHESATGTANIVLSSGVSSLQLYVDSNAAAQVSGGGSATSLLVGTSNSSPLKFNTNSITKAEIATDGRFNINNTLSIGYSEQQTFTGAQKLKVNGSIVTTGATYPDYVFEKYFTGISDIDPEYKFSKLEEVRDFVKKNHHLPGVISIKELQKSEGGFDFDLTQLSIQQLEKIEELYLHSFEQEASIKKQQFEIAALHEKLERLEQLISK
ncbi:hypothetical protein [Chryseobacterium shigense]|uniref:Chaperone of endosialidase n=1 Tax=Chryseobacterium shigense TaxID=297244 RepID=A0A841N1H4_9FLAO|nr:hypothetical protein [Chryseobacterium shigense]MBB6370996.1 hypothetical protein [Chryseobacterium shigense]